MLLRGKTKHAFLNFYVILEFSSILRECPMLSFSLIHLFDFGLLNHRFVNSYPTLFRLDLKVFAEDLSFKIHIS